HGQGPRHRGPFFMERRTSIDRRTRRRAPMKTPARTAVTDLDRRTMLATGALALAGAAAPSVPAHAEVAPKAMFPVAAVTIPIVGATEVSQARRIYCIGRNYAAHAIERGSDPTREPPFFFQKP